jgi:NAD(P)-dependent dehydrogenase (short-subunit alcohol dehydrogenase family)
MIKKLQRSQFGRRAEQLDSDQLQLGLEDLNTDLARAAYVASKHAVVGLTKAAAVDYAETGIRVNVICPGYVETPFTSKTMAAQGGTILRRVPVQRLGTAEEIAEAVVWLCSERASFVTGATLAADGGYSAI